tara:strand:- start:1556 stop:6784 length:5229 start_codon:yes stop_codon:yes gene_type:complete
MQLELGDIIKIISSQLKDYHEKVFVITFLNKERIVLQNIVSNEISELVIKDNKLLNKFIENIHILKRHERKGFVQQNKMAINMWIDIHGLYNTDIPFSMTGQITNIIQDMIEVTIHSLEENTIIYIDFAYQGISPDSFIKNINIRDKPLEETDQQSDNNLSDALGDINNETMNIDKIVFHEDILDTLKVKEIKHSHQHAYSLDTQINDMVEDILGNNSNPSRGLLREISILTERYKHLHNQYISKTKIDKKYEPHWSMNVVTNKPVLFIDDEEYIDEYISTDFDQHLYDLETELNNQYTTNSYAERYQKTIEIINNFYKQYDNESYDNTEKVEHRKECIQSNSQVIPNDIQSYSVCIMKNPIGKYISTPSFKNTIVLPGDMIHIDSILYLPETSTLNGIAKLKSTNILEKVLINEAGLSNYNKNKSKKYDVVYVAPDADDKIFEKLFEKYLHVKYDPSTMTHAEFKSKMIPSNDVIIKRIIKKLNNKNLSFHSLIKHINKYSLDKDDVNIESRTMIDEFINMRLLKFKQEIISNKNTKVNVVDLSSTRSFFLELYKENIEKYIDEFDINVEFESTSEILSKMMEYDNMDLFISSILLKKNDFLDFTKFNKTVNDYIDINDGIVSKNKCSNYYLSKQYSTLKQLEADNEKDIYFDTEFDKTNYKMFDDEELQNRDKCVNELIIKYKLTEEDAMYEYESMKNKQRKVRDGDFALFYTEGKFKMFIRKKNIWAVTEKFSGMSGKEIFCNIQKDCFTLPSNNCSDLKDKKKLTILNDAKDSLSDFDKDIVSKKTIFKEIMMKTYQGNIQKIGLNAKHRVNQAFKQSRLLYKIGTTYIPSGAEESPYSDIFQSILNIKDLELKYKYLIKFCANFTRDANVLGTDESLHWKYCVKTNLKLVPLFIYKMAVSYHKSRLTYEQEITNICKNQGVLSDDGEMYIDQHSGYVIKQIEFNDSYQPDYAPIRVTDSPQINVYSVVKDISKDYQHYIKNIIEKMCENMVIQLQDSQKDYIFRNVVDDFNKYFEAVPTPDEKKKDTVHSYYIMYYTLSYLSIEILTSIPDIQTNDQYPGCVKSFTGWPITDKSDVSGLLYISCIAFSIAKNIFPWKVLRQKIQSVTKPSIDVVCSTIQLFLEKIINKKISVVKKINSKIIYNEKVINRVKPIVPKSSKIFLPPQKPFTIDFVLTNKDMTNMTRERVQTKSFYYTISLFKNIQDLVKRNTDDSLLVDEPMLEKINDLGSFIQDKNIQENLKVLQKINTLLKNKKYTTVLSKQKTFDLHFPNTLNDYLKNKSIIHSYILNNIDDYEEEIRLMYPGLPEVIPREELAFSDMLKENSINITNENFKQIYSSNNLKTLFDSSLYYKEQLNNKTEFENILNDNNDNEYITKLFDMVYIEKKDIAKNNMYKEIQEKFEVISDYVNMHGSQKNSDKKIFKNTLQNLVDSTIEITNFWEPIRKTKDEVNIWHTMSKSLSDIESETTNNATKNLINVITYLTHPLPEMIKNIKLDLNNRFDNVPCPKHWDISEIHKDDITRIIKQHYNFLEKYNRCPEEIISELSIYTNIVKDYPKLCVIIKKHFEMSSNNETLYLTILYMLFETINSLINVTSELEDRNISICFANIIYDVIALHYFSNTFKQFNISNEDVYASVKRVKESEKNTILNKLEQMNDEQRDIDNEYKKYSIGDWSSGKFRTYDKIEYDQAHESNIYKNDEFMSELLGDVYVKGDLDFEEAYDMSDIHEDDIDPNSDE